MTNKKNIFYNLRLCRLSLTTFMIISLILPSISFAGYIGDEIKIAINAYDQQNPHVIFMPNKGDGIYFVVWEDWRNLTTTGADIYGRFIKADGTLCGYEFIISNAPGNQTAPRAAYRMSSLIGSGDDTIVVIWQDTRFSKTGPPPGSSSTLPGGYLYFRAIKVTSLDLSNCSGFTMNGARSIDFENDSISGTSFTANARFLPKIIFDQINDRFIMAWVESRTIRKTVNYLIFPSYKGGFEVYLTYGDTQFVGQAAFKGDLTDYSVDPNNPTKKSTPTIISMIKDSTFSALNRLPSDFTRAKLIYEFSGPFNHIRGYEFFDKVMNVDLACDETSNECLLVWEAQRALLNVEYECIDDPNVGIKGVCDDPDVIKLNTDKTKVTYDPHQTIYVHWEKEIPMNVSAVRVSDGGAKAHYPSVGFDKISKRFLVAWEDMRTSLNGKLINNPPNKKILGQLISSGSGLYQSNFIISYSDTDFDGKQDANMLDSEQSRPYVSYDPVNQRFFVVWQDGRNTSLSLENLDIYGQKVDTDGSLRGYNYPIYTLPYNQLAPVIALNPVLDQFLGLWKDARNTDISTCSAAGGPNTGTRPCGSDLYGQLFTLGNPAFTLLTPDNTPLEPPILQDFENPPGSGSVEVGLSATKSFKIRSSGDTTLRLDCIDFTCAGENPSGIAPFSFDGLASQLLQCGDNQTINLTPSNELRLTVRFKPTAGGTYNRCFIIKSDGGNKRVNLSALAIEANIQIAPVSHNFGNTYIGNSKTKTFVVSNTGLATLRISSVIAPNAPFSILTDECSGKGIPPGQTCNIVAKFEPLSVGTFSSRFVVKSNDPDTPNLRVNLKGTALGAPSITVNPLTVNFGNIEVGKSSQQTVSVSNTGTEALNITEITNPTTPFSKVGHNCPATLAIGDSCQINVKFSPTTAGSFSSSFNIKSNDPVKPTVKVTLNGVGIAIPDILVEPLVVIFPDTNVGFSSETNINVKNLGTGNLIINSVIPPTSSDFTISSNNCVGALVPNTTCQIKVKFSPTTAGQKQSSLTINSNDPDSPTVTVNLTGTGIIIPPDISVTPLSIDFGNVTVGQSSAPRTVTVSNIGGSNLMITSVVYPGTPFTILEDTCKGKNIAPNASCTIKIVFQPTRAITYYPYYLHINSNDPDTPQAKVTLQGTGVW